MYGLWSWVVGWGPLVGLIGIGLTIVLIAWVHGHYIFPWQVDLKIKMIVLIEIR
jgi:hypothetical protein